MVLYYLITERKNVAGELPFDVPIDRFLRQLRSNFPNQFHALG